MKEINALDRVYTWCVSGTPFNKKFDEMYCVMVLLKVYHYCISSVWKQCVEVPFAIHNDLQIPLINHDSEVMNRLADLVTDYYWCTNMKDLEVLSPNLIPPQTRVVHTVALTNIEVKTRLSYHFIEDVLQSGKG